MNADPSDDMSEWRFEPAENSNPAFIQRRKYALGGEWPHTRVGVSQHQCVLVYHQDQLITEWRAGEYQLANFQSSLNPTGTMEIIWFDMSPTVIQWGIPAIQGLFTKDNLQLGLNGTITLRVIGVVLFLQNAIFQQQIFTRSDLQMWILRHLRDPLACLLRDTSVDRINSKQRMKIEAKIQEEIVPIFRSKGVEILEFRINSAIPITEFAQNYEE